MQTFVEKTLNMRNLNHTNVNLKKVEEYARVRPKILLGASNGKFF